MPFEVIRGEDLRVVFSKLQQSAYGTRLTDANLNGGKSFRLNTAVLAPPIIGVRGEEGPKPFSGDEFNRAGDERDLVRDTQLSLALPLNSWIALWAAGFTLGAVTSVQEGTTTHYTHTIRARDPLAASGVRQARVTSIYIDSGSADSGRFRHVLQDLALAGFTISGRIREMVQLAFDLIGSGQEVTNPTITIPALEAHGQNTSMLFSGQSIKIEIGNKGGALTDITERVREWSFRATQNLAADDGYHPGSGKFRGRLWHLTRTFTADLAVFVNRADRAFYDDMLALTEKEVKITIDSGVRAGTSTTTNHQVIIRLPACRFTAAPISFEDAGAVYGINIAENQVYKDAGIADSPCTITVDNTESSLFA